MGFQLSSLQDGLNQNYCSGSRNGLQTRMIGNYLAQEHDVYILGLQTQGSPIKFGNMKVLPRFDDEWAQDSLPYWLDKFDFDCFFTLLDVWVRDVWTKMGEEYPFIPYLPIDSAPLSWKIRENLESATLIVPFSDFGVEQLEDAGFYNHFKIPHGFDSSVHYRLSQEEIMKFKREFGIEDRFVFLSVGMNVGFRKGFWKLFEAYSKFLDETGADDTLLWVHSDPNSSRGARLDKQAELEGLKISRDEKVPEDADVQFSPDLHQSKTPWGDEEMNRLYNMADVHLAPSMGEGFGLCTLESMAVGVPNIATNFSTFPEFFGDNERGLLADVSDWWTTPLAQKQALVDADSFKDQMIKYYEDRELLKKHSKKAGKFAKNYKFENLKPKWDELMKKLEEGLI